MTCATAKASRSRGDCAESRPRYSRYIKDEPESICKANERRARRSVSEPDSHTQCVYLLIALFSRASKENTKENIKT